MKTPPTIAVIIPAYNEDPTIRKVILDFHREVPDALIVVIDNNSSDRTYEQAKLTAAEVTTGGCTILRESRQGKAAAIKRAFSDIEADIYVMVDADCTYPAHDLPSLLQPILDDEADVVIANRHAGGAYGRENKRPFHNWGNRFVRYMINTLFHGKLEDILSGYRVMSRRFVKNYPILSVGFGIETEMSIHILDKGFRVVELPTHYMDRPVGSESKLHTIRDGIRIILLIFNVFIHFKPLLFFTLLSLVLVGLGMVAGSLPIIEFFQTSFISHLPLAVLAVGLTLTGILAFFTGIVLANSYRCNRFTYEHTILQNSQ